MCQIINQIRIVQHYYNPNNNTNPNPILQANPTSGYSNSNISVQNGIMNCSFTRQMSMPGTDNFFDISNTPYNLLVASGTYDPNTSKSPHFENISRNIQF